MNVQYWRGVGGFQNLGDFLTELLLEELFLPIAVRGGAIHVIGSVVDDYFFRAQPAEGSSNGPDERLVFWGCGLRTPGGLSERNRGRCEILSVRGPLTRSALRLGDSVPIGDPAFLLPALYRPASPRKEESHRTLCIPHYNDTRSDAELIELSGCSALLRTAIPASLEAVRRSIDAIVGADFVLTASLHGAVIAAAYGRPFAPWANGHLDLPFKWADLAASLSMPDRFAADHREGERLYFESVAPTMRVPSMWDAIAAAPLALRPEALLRVASLEVERGFLAPDAQALLAAAAAFRSGRRQVGERSGHLEEGATGGADWVATAIRSAGQRAEGSLALLQHREVALDGAERRAIETAGKLTATERALEAAVRERDEARGATEAARRSLEAAECTATGAHAELQTVRAELLERTRERDAAREEASRQAESWPARFGRRGDSLGRLPNRIGHAAAVAVELVGFAVRGRLLEGLRLRSHARLIRRAWLLDEDFYVAQCGDDPEARRDPVRHYLRRGAAAGLDPNPFFDTTYYVERHVSAARYGKNPLVHYIRYGAREGLDPGPAFDSAHYLGHCPCARTSGLTPLSHFLVYGRGAGFPAAPPATPAPGTPESRADSGFAEATLLHASGLGLPPTDRVLVVDHRMLTPDQDSGSVRMFGIVKLLAEIGHEVTFVSDSLERMPDYEAKLRPYAPRILHGLPDARAHLEAEGGAYRHAILSRPEPTHRFLSTVRAFAPNAYLAYDMVDVHWVRMTRAAELTGDLSARREAERLRKMERVNSECADLVLAITDKEREIVDAETPSARVVVVPNVHSARTAVPGATGRSGLVFIGGFEHQPNVDAVLWFVREILPRVHRAIPGVEFKVLGSKPTEEVLGLRAPLVDVTGFVPDVDPHFDRGRVFVSPLRYGAGMKGKIGQAMALGLPVVTTSIGAEGMRLVHGETALVADSPEAFADAVALLYRDGELWERISGNARRHVEEHFSEKTVRELLARLFPVAGPAAPIHPSGGSRGRS